jgi:hypothetical protein
MMSGSDIDNKKVIKLLIKSGADLNARGKNGLPPIHQTISIFQFETAAHNTPFVPIGNQSPGRAGGFELAELNRPKGGGDYDQEMEDRRDTLSPSYHDTSDGLWFREKRSPIRTPPGVLAHG